MADANDIDKVKYRHDTGHLSPTNFELTLYMWHRTALRPRRDYSLDYDWGGEPPDIALVRFRASGVMARTSRVFDVHLATPLDDIPVQTWPSMGMLAKAIQAALATQQGVACKPIDRTVIDVDYTENTD